MSIPAAYAVVILIWSTTPLAVKWSGEGPGDLFGAPARMACAALLCLLLVTVLRAGLPWHSHARRTYAAATLGVYGAMLCVYWGAQYIPSGMVAVLFGTTPIVTGLLARIWLEESALTPVKLAGSLLGVIGLAVLFSTGLELGPRAVEGIAVVLAGVVLHSTSTVWVKRLNSSLPGITVTSGALLFAVPLYFITWLVLDGRLPHQVPDRALLSIAYLGVIGSALGFTLYYYILRNTAASGIALITLVAPVLALLIGAGVNDEPMGTDIWAGSLLVLSGLLFHQWEQGIRVWLPGIRGYRK